MNRYLISAAALALMAAPVFAQPDGRFGHPGTTANPAPGAPAPPQAAPAPAPQAAPQRGGAAPGGGAMHGGGDHRDGGAMRGAAGAPAAGGQPGDRGGFDRGGNRGGSRPDANSGRPQFGNGDRGMNDNRGGGNGFRDQGGNFRDHGPGGNFHGGGQGFRGGPGGGHDFSSFRDFHRTLSAPHRFRAPAYNRPSGWYSRRWTFGDILPSLFWSQQYWLNDYDDYDLPPPPPGAVWVRNGSDALLIDRYSGEIITVEYSVFY